MTSDWTPPRQDSHGRYDFGDWRPVRAAVEAAYGALGREGGEIAPDDFKLVGLALDYAAHANRESCSSCHTKLRPREVIRCLECKAPLCEACAPRHFWPNGRAAPGHKGGFDAAI